MSFRVHQNYFQLSLIECTSIPHVALLCQYLLNDVFLGSNFNNGSPFFRLPLFVDQIGN